MSIGCREQLDVGCSSTAMLDGFAPSESRVSTGLVELDAVLSGLYWGDNVVWELDGAPADPFYRAIAQLADAFDDVLWIAVASDPARIAKSYPTIEVVDARPGTKLAEPIKLLRHINRSCDPRRRNLLLFDALDGMVDSWDADTARRFFARCCPILLQVGAIAYWSMDLREIPSTLRDTVEAATQCVLRVDERSVRVVKAEGRAEGARGSLLHWHRENGRAILSPTGVGGQVAASLRAVRRSRSLSQQQLARLAGVTPSAISQAERAERSLSLTTLVRIGSALGMTVDDLLHGEDPPAYRIGRRTEDPRLGPEDSIVLLGDGDADISVDLVHLHSRESGAPPPGRGGRGLIAVCAGLVQVQIGGLTPAVRHGEVLLADSNRIDAWRNLGEREAVLFWIVILPARA